MAKKRIKDLNRSARKAKRQIDRMVKRQDKAAEKRDVQAKKREEANIARQEMISDTTPSKQYTKKKKRYEKKVERKVEKGQYKSDGTRMTQDDFMTYDQKIQSQDNKSQKRQQKKAVRKGLMKSLGSAISDRASKEGTEFIENLATTISGEQTGNPSPEQVGDKVVTEGVNKAKNTQELTDARNQGSQSEDAIKQAEEEIDKNAQEQYDEVTEEIENRKSIKDAAKDGAGYTLPAKSSLSDLTDDELKKLQGEIWRNAAKNKASLPNQLLEKLDHTDYYPPQQEFLQSTFTGARIGSQQIISAVPARIPLGLYDARKVAMQKKAKEKEEQLKKLASLNFETAEQFQARLNDEGLDIVFGYVDLFDGDIEAMYRGDTKASQMFLKDLQKLEDIAKEITNVDKHVDTILKEVNSKTHYTPKKVVEKIVKWQEGRQDIKSLVKDYDKSNSFLKEGRSIQNWTNFQQEARVVLKDLQTTGGWRDYVGKAQDLIDLSADQFQAQYKKSKIEWATDAGDAIYKAEKFSDDYESYRETVVEYYPVDKVRELVEQMYNGNNFYEGSTQAEKDEIILDGIKYFMSQLPTKVTTELSHQQNKLAERMQARTAQRRLEYDQTQGIGVHETLYNDILPEYPALKNILATTAPGSAERIEQVRTIYDRVSWTNSAGSTAEYGHMSGEIEGFEDVTFFDTNMDNVDVMYKGVLYGPDELITELENEKSGKTAAEQKILDQQIKFLQQDNFELVATEQRAYMQVADGGVLYPIENYSGSSDDIHLSVDVMGKGVYQTGGTAAKPEYSPTPFTFISDKDLESKSQRRRMDGKASRNYRENSEYQKSVNKIYDSRP